MSLRRRADPGHGPGGARARVRCRDPARFGCENRGSLPKDTRRSDRARRLSSTLDGGEPIDAVLGGPPADAADRRTMRSCLCSASRTRRRRGSSGFGPFPSELGHCGIGHVIDFDGSFWVPVGQIDGDSPTIINTERGHDASARVRISPNSAANPASAVAARPLPGPEALLGLRLTSGPAGILDARCRASSPDPSPSPSSTATSAPRSRRRSCGASPTPRASSSRPRTTGSSATSSRSRRRARSRSTATSSCSTGRS